MTYGYWFWLAIGCIACAVLLLMMTAKKKPRGTRTVHTIVLLALLAFGGFKCARDEHQRTELLDNAPAAYTVGVTAGDEGGMRLKQNSQFVEAVEFSYTLGGKNYKALGMLDQAYTVERDFYPRDIAGKCVVVQAVATRPEISRLAAVMASCPETAPAGGWNGLPEEILEKIDDTWWRGLSKN